MKVDFLLKNGSFCKLLCGFNAMKIGIRTFFVIVLYLKHSKNKSIIFI